MSDSGSKLRLKAGAGKGLRVGLVVASFNSEYTERLLNGAQRRLKALGVVEKALKIVRVPGALELPLACQRLASSKKFDAVIALGCVLRGETSHYDLVCQGTLQGLQRVGLDARLPVIFGVITCDTKAQALARCNGGPKDAGIHAAEAAVWMARPR